MARLSGTSHKEFPTIIDVSAATGKTWKHVRSIKRSTLFNFQPKNYAIKLTSFLRSSYVEFGYHKELNDFIITTLQIKKNSKEWQKKLSMFRQRFLEEVKIQLKV